MTKFFRKKMHFFSKKSVFLAKMRSWAAICDRNFGGIVPKFTLAQGGVRRYKCAAKCKGKARNRPNILQKKCKKSAFFFIFVAYLLFFD